MRIRSYEQGFWSLQKTEEGQISAPRDCRVIGQLQLRINRVTAKFSQQDSFRSRLSGRHELHPHRARPIDMRNYKPEGQGGTVSERHAVVTAGSLRNCVYREFLGDFRRFHVLWNTVRIVGEVG